MKVVERFVVVISMDVHEGCAHMVSVAQKAGQLSNGERPHTPLKVLGCVVVKARAGLGKLPLFAECFGGKRRCGLKGRRARTAEDDDRSRSRAGCIYQRSWAVVRKDMKDGFGRTRGHRTCPLPTRVMVASWMSRSSPCSLRRCFTPTWIFGEDTSSSPSSMSSPTVAPFMLSSPPTIFPDWIPTQSNVECRKQCKMLLNLTKVERSKVVPILGLARSRKM